jgi:peptidoglycan hydrolase CwlO-like protein
MELQTRYEAQVGDMNARINDLTITNEKLKITLTEKEKTTNTLQKALTHIDAVREPKTDAAEFQREGDETEAMHAALRDIANAVIDDTDRQLDDGDGEEISPSLRSARSTSPLRSRSPRPGSRRGQSRSPLRSRSPCFGDNTFVAVQTALNKRQLQVQELRARLNSCKDHGQTLKKQIDDSENERRRLEHQLMDMREELENK